MRITDGLQSRASRDQIFSFRKWPPTSSVEDWLFSGKLESGSSVKMLLGVIRAGDDEAQCGSAAECGQRGGTFGEVNEEELRGLRERPRGHPGQWRSRHCLPGGRTGSGWGRRVHIWEALNLSSLLANALGKLQFGLVLLPLHYATSDKSDLFLGPQFPHL